MPRRAPPGHPQVIRPARSPCACTTPEHDHDQRDEGQPMGSVIKKRRKRMAKKKHRKLLRKTRHQRRNKK
ncbi:hypothetical protein GCM10009584_15020 [Ornithinimicrobium humiphilum]